MKRDKKKYYLILFLVFLGIGSIYFFNQVESIYGGDGGDLVSAIITNGIPHPPGYPLYTLAGIILSKIIHSGTWAWRIGFLSSLPSLLSLILLFDLLYFLIRKITPALISILALAFFYPFWLYSEVVEVFALNNLFIIILLWLLFRWKKNGKKVYIYLASFIFGLSLTHHHIIFFLIPALGYLFLKGRKKFDIKSIFLSLALFLGGLTPYLYPVFSARFNPEVNWQGQPTFMNFLKLVTRTSYGIFRSGPNITHSYIVRLVDLYAFFDFLYKDFRLLGLILICFGILFMFNREKTVFTTILLGIASYLFFIFYSSFSLRENFSVATFERFVQPLYILLTFLVAFGFVGLGCFIQKAFFLLLGKNKSLYLCRLVQILFFIYPVGLFILNYPKISILKRDFTAENLGRDILNTVSEKSILILATDTPLFDTQYVYYSEKRWPAVKLIHFSKLFQNFYFNQLEKFYPDLYLPDKDKTDKEKIRLFFSNNYNEFPIYSKFVLKGSDGVWIPEGLLFRYYKKEDLPSKEEIFEKNESLWMSYFNPLSGSLSFYKNLMLSDVLRVYGIARQETAFWEVKNGFNKEAEKHLLRAQELIPVDTDSFKILVQVYIKQKRCNDAQRLLEQMMEENRDDLEVILLARINSSSCFRDSKKADYFKKLYEEKSRERETPLKKL